MLAETACLFDNWPLEPAPAPSPAEEKLRDAKPRFQPIDRKQTFLRTVDVESLIGENHAARAIWSVVQQLDLSAFSEQARAVKAMPAALPSTRVCWPACGFMPTAKA
jgi:hypothetical protein